MKAGRWSAEKKLGFILGFLMVIILGLVVGICFVMLNRTGDDAGGGDDGESTQNVLSYDEAQYRIFDYYDSAAKLTDSTTEDEIRGYITQTIKYIDELYDSYDDAESRANILIAKVWFLKDFRSYVEEAIHVGEEVENMSLSSEQKRLLYEFMGDAYSSLGDETKASEYYGLSTNNDSGEEY